MDSLHWLTHAHTHAHNTYNRRPFKCTRIFPHYLLSFCVYVCCCCCPCASIIVSYIFPFFFTFSPFQSTRPCACSTHIYFWRRDLRQGYTQTPTHFRSLPWQRVQEIKIYIIGLAVVIYILGGKCAERISLHYQPETNFSDEKITNTVVWLRILLFAFKCDGIFVFSMQGPPMHSGRSYFIRILAQNCLIVQSSFLFRPIFGWGPCKRLYWNVLPI